MISPLSTAHCPLTTLFALHTLLILHFYALQQQISPAFDNNVVVRTFGAHEEQIVNFYLCLACLAVANGFVLMDDDFGSFH